MDNIAIKLTINDITFIDRYIGIVKKLYQDECINKSTYKKYIYEICNGNTKYIANQIKKFNNFQIDKNKPNINGTKIYNFIFIQRIYNDGLISLDNKIKYLMRFIKSDYEYFNTKYPDYQYILQNNYLFFGSCQVTLPNKMIIFNNSAFTLTNTFTKTHKITVNNFIPTIDIIENNTNDIKIINFGKVVNKNNINDIIKEYNLVTKSAKILNNIINNNDIIIAGTIQIAIPPQMIISDGKIPKLVNTLTTNGQFKMIDNICVLNILENENNQVAIINPGTKFV